MKRCSNKFRRGTAYVLVLSVAMLVAVIGIAAVTIMRVQLRTATLTSDTEEARGYAQSAVELTRVWCYNNSSWRTTRSAGAWASGVAIGNGSFSVSVADPIDGDISNSPLDPLVVTATGYKGNARQVIQVTLKPAPTAYTCLQAGVVSAGTLLVNSGRLTVGGASAATNGNLTVGAVLDGNGEATGTCSGTGYLGSRAAGVTARKMPDSTVFDYYTRNGTAISFSSIGGGDLGGLLLSPASNPYGSTNANGIYVIDCGGNKIKIHNCRVVGTLVVLNPRVDSDLSGDVNFAPAVTGYPVLMIKGSVSLSFDNGSLVESAGKNFNPPGTPYNGVSNSTATDSYPSVFNGLVYVSGFAWLSSTTTITGGLVVGGSMQSDSTPTVTYDATSANNPPPGFFDPPPMKVYAPSWAQGVN